MMKRLLPYLVFVALCLFTAYPLFHNLGKLTLRMWDESRIAVNAIEMKNNGNYMVPYYEGQPDMWNTKPLLLTWSVIASTSVWGQNEFGVRFPSALCGFILIISIFLYFRLYLKDFYGGLIGALALASFYGFIEYHVARNGDFDSMLTTWTFLSTCFLFIGFEQKNNKWTGIAALFLVLAFLTKGIAAGILLPGAFLYFLFKDRQSKYLFKSKIIPFTFISIVVSAGYYFLREYNNDGFLSNVLTNEITGRYINAAEGHQEPFTFYISTLYTRGIDGWFFIFLFSILLGFFYSNERIKNFFYYTLLILVIFLFIHSLSSTKLPWYIAPAYPHIAIIIGTGCSTLFQWVSKLNTPQIKSAYLSALLSLIVLVFYFRYPYKNINNSSVQAKKEQTYPELFFGDRISDYLSRSSHENKFTVVHQEYNSSLEYYFQKYKSEGVDLQKKHFQSSFTSGEVLLLCEQAVFDNIINRYQTENIIQDKNYWVVKINIPNQPEINPAELKEANQLLNSKLSEIRATPEWNAAIQEKARKNKLDFEQQLRLDAVWVLEDQKKISAEAAAYLRANK